MPFDTTYHFSKEGASSSFSVTFPGGKDTSIILQEGDTIPGHENFYALDSLVRAYQLNDAAVQEQNKNTGNAPLFFISIIVLYVIFRLWLEKRRAALNASLPAKTKIERSAYLTYYGEALNFSDKEISLVLEKHFPYFNKLQPDEKEKFLERTQLFIADKVFKIHCNPGFKEMPILISAAAVQLTFGLRKYLLPNFKFIHVYPQEFVGIHPTLRVLEGNVSGHTINLSWKHFLEGFKNPCNGQNTGLHEMAHALHYQTFVVEENADRNFRDSFDSFTEYGNKVYEQEQKPGNDLYSDYALKNFQEFWAESMEIFFEKPWQLKTAYPALYNALVALLNQDPCITTPKPAIH